jgi:hypothetical protein
MGEMELNRLKGGIAGPVRTIPIWTLKFVLLCGLVLAPISALASGIKAVPSVESVDSGGMLFVDVVVEDIPAGGLGTIQFRLNVSVTESEVAGVPDISQSSSGKVSVVTPLIIGPSTENHSGLGGFFWNGRGSHGVLAIDNEPLTNGSALYTFGHTSGAAPPSGTGSVARFYISVGKDVTTGAVDIGLSDVVLLESGEVYPLGSNIGATVVIGGYSVEDVADLSYTDKEADETGTVVLAWVPPDSTDIAGYRVYDATGSVLTSVADGTATGTEVIGLPNGPSQLVVKAYDASNNESEGVSITVEPLDDFMPRVTVTGVEDGGYYSGDITPSVTVDDVGDTTIEALLNGSTYDFTPISLEGSNLLSLTVQDSAGNTTTVDIGFIIDKIAPSILISGVENATYYNNDVTPIVDVTDANLSDIEIFINGAPFDSGSVIQAEGSYEIAVNAEDLAGNESSVITNFYIDRVVPESALVIGEPKYQGDELYVTDSLQFVLDVQDAGAWASGVDRIEYRIDGDVWTDYVQPFGFYGLEDGEKVIEYRAVDIAGNVEQIKSASVWLDTTAPEMEIVPGEPHYIGESLFVTTESAFTYSVSDALSGVASIEYRVDSGQWRAYDGPFSVSGEGGHAIEYRATDNLGNASDVQALAFIVDDSTPETSIAVGEPQHENMLLFVKGTTEFTLDSMDQYSGVYVIEYRLDEGEWNEYTSAFNVTGEGGHYVYYRAKDNLGNIEADNSLLVFVDDSFPDVSVVFGQPRYEGESLYVTSTSEITMEAEDSGVGVMSMEMDLDGAGWQQYDGSITVKGEGTHVIAARATDWLDNTWAPGAMEFVVDDTAPETTVTVGDPKQEGDALYISSSTEFTLSSTDALSGVAATEYRIDSGQWNAYAPFAIAIEGEHTVGYRSTDNVDNVETEKTLAVVVDNTAPKTTITVGEPKHEGDALYVSSAAEFTLTATDSLSGVALSEYRVDGGEWTDYAPFSLKAEGQHTISFRSTDTQGNVEAEQSIAVVVDNTAPYTTITVGDQKYEGNALYVTGNTEFELSATDYLSGVSLTEYRLDEGQWTAYSLFAITEEGEHTIGYRSVDNLGNVEVEQTLEVIVDNTPPETYPQAGKPWHIGDDAIYVTSMTGIAFAATDMGSGVQAILYRIDESQWGTYTGAFMLSGEGEHTVYYRSVDQLGNTEAVKSIVLMVDDTPPVTDITVGEPGYDSTALYVTSETEFTLSSSDTLSGVTATEYRIDGGQWNAYAPFAIATEGEHTIGYRSTDNLGNVEIEQTLKVIVDDTPPLTSIGFGTQSYAEGSTIYLTKNTPVTLTAVDEYSGPAVTYYRYEGETLWRTYGGPFMVEDLGFGQHEIWFYSIDNLGNTEAEQHMDIMVIGVDVTVDVIQATKVLIWTEEAEADKHLAFISKALSGTGAYVSVVTTREEFITKLRSGVYNITAILKADTPIDANVRREVREAVNKGMGLILSAWGNNVHPITAEELGIIFTGSRPMDIDERTMELAGQTFTVYSRVLKAQLNGGEQVGSILADPGKRNGNPTVPVPAVVLNEYGDGKTVYMGFDLLGSAHYTGDLRYEGLFRNMVEYVTPDNEPVGAHSTVLVETTVTANGATLDVRAMEVLGAGVEYLPLFDLTEESLVFEFTLGDGESQSYRYFIRLPNVAGEHDKNTWIDLNINGQYEVYELFSYVFTVPDDTGTLLAKAGTWLEEQALNHPAEAGALAEMGLVLDALSVTDLNSLSAVEAAIVDSVGVIEAARGLSFDASEFRALMDEYLRIAEVCYVKAKGADTIEQSMSITMSESGIVANSVDTPATGDLSENTMGSLTLEITVTDYPRVLVWLNDGCASLGLVEGCISKDLVSLTLKDTPHNVVESAGSFATELRNDYYTDYLILGDAELLTDISERELMARVYGGRGLISSHWMGSRALELFGIDSVSGFVGFGGTIDLMVGEIYKGGIVDIHGEVIGVEPVDPMSVVAITDQGAPAALKAQYGYGRTLFMAYDQGLSLTDLAVEDWRVVLGESLAYVHTVQEGLMLYPGEIRPVRVSATSQTDADITVSLSYNPSMLLIDMATGAAVESNPQPYAMSLSAGVPGWLFVYAMVPDAIGTYGVMADIGGTSASTLFIVENNTAAVADEIISMLNNLKVTGAERQTVKWAASLIEGVKTRAVHSVADIEQNLIDVLAVVDAVQGIMTAPVDGALLELSSFVGIWQERWYTGNLK